MPRKSGGKKIAPHKGSSSRMLGDLTDFERLMQAAILDHDFASRLVLCPDNALKELGIEVTPEKLHALADCVNPLSEAYEAFGGIKRLIG